MKAIITGATGAIGMALIRLLRTHKIEVVAIVRPESSRNSRLKEFSDVTVIACSLDRLTNLVNDDRMDEADFFFHLGWSGTTGDLRDNLELQLENVRDTLGAVELAYLTGCKVFVGAGSQAEYGIFHEKLSEETRTVPTTGYGIAKLCAGQMSRQACRQRGIRHIWARILSVYGPYDGENSMIISSLRKMLQNEPTSFSKAEQEWDYLYCDDAANALYLSALKGRNQTTYVVGSGVVRPLQDYIAVMNRLSGSTNEPGIGKLPYSEQQAMYLCADINSLQYDTGFYPQVDFEEGIKRTIEWCRLTGG